MNEPLLKRITRTSRLTSSVAREMEGLARDLKDLDPSDPETVLAFKQQWVTTSEYVARVNNHVKELTDLINELGERAGDISQTAGDVASYATDTVQIMTQMDKLDDIAAIPWARLTRELKPALLWMAVKEVATHEGGGGKLELLRDAINEVLSPAEGG